MPRLPLRSRRIPDLRAAGGVVVLVFLAVCSRAANVPAVGSSPAIEVSVIMDYGVVLDRVSCAKGVGCLFAKLAPNNPGPARIGVYASPSDAPWTRGEALVADAIRHRPAKLDRGSYPKLSCVRGAQDAVLELVSTRAGKPDPSVRRLTDWRASTIDRLYRTPLWTDSLVLVPVATIGEKRRVAVRLASGVDRSAWIQDKARVKWLRADRTDPVTGGISWSAQAEVRDSACIRAVARGGDCVLDVPGGAAWYRVEIRGRIAATGGYRKLLEEPEGFELLTEWTRME